MSNLSEIDYVKINARYVKKLKYGLHVNRLLCDAMEREILERLDKIPKKIIRKEDNFSESLINKETGEVCYDLKPMVNQYHRLKKTLWVLCAMFKNEKGEVKQHVVGSKYTRSPVDYIYNATQKRIVTNLYKNYLSETEIYNNYNLMHLVLTVPHVNGLFRGKKFYGHELTKSFNIIRKNPKFKKFIWGGEYGMEQTHTKKNGYHIHLHSLVFQYKNKKVNDCRKMLQDLWKKETGGNLWYETLYVHLKDSKGRWITETKPKEEILCDDEANNFVKSEEKIVLKKFRLGEQYSWFKKLSPQEKKDCYLFGIMECIKYHFKVDIFKNEKGEYDGKIIHDYLVNNKGLRKYSRYGGLLGDSRLNIKKKIMELEQTELEFDTIEDLELSEADEYKTDISKSTSKIVNPFTNEFATREDYTFCITPISNINVSFNTQKDTIFQTMGERSQYFQVRQNFNDKDIIKLLHKNNYGDLLETEDYRRLTYYIRFGGYCVN